MGHWEYFVTRIILLCLSQVVRAVPGVASAEEAAALQVARATTMATAVGAAAAEGAALAPALATSPLATTRVAEEAFRRGEQGQAGDLMYLGQ